MKKNILLSLGLLFICVISATNVAYSFSVSKPIYSSELMKYIKGSEFIKLSFKDFSMLTGEQENLRNRISFSVLKMRIKHDLKKNANLILSEYNTSKHKMNLGLKILLWVLGVILVLMLTIVIIFGGQKT